MFDDAVPGGSAALPGPLVPYFERAPRVFDDPAHYADSTATLTNSRTMEWLHPLGDIVGALTGAGLRLAWLRENASVPWPVFRTLVRGDDRLWTWPNERWLPLSLSLRATRSD